MKFGSDAVARFFRIKTTHVLFAVFLYPSLAHASYFYAYDLPSSAQRYQTAEAACNAFGANLANGRTLLTATYGGTIHFGICNAQYSNGTFGTAQIQRYIVNEEPPSELAFTGPTETRPSGTGGISTLMLTAKVTSSSTPKHGVTLGFLVDVTANTGGHEHHDNARPKGTLSGIQGTTDANGEVTITFRAPEVAGIHTVKATCVTCTNTSVTKVIQVKVPDLLPISPNPPQNADGSFVYALTSVDKTHQGNGRYHHQQYYLTEQSLINLQSMIADLAEEGWGTVALNDASLYWGGRYDISANWAGSHKGHRDGREIDISFARAGNTIPASKQNIFYDKFCKNNKVSFPFSILHHYVLWPHFHVFLEKQQACFKTEQ